MKLDRVDPTLSNSHCLTSNIVQQHCLQSSDGQTQNTLSTAAHQAWLVQKVFFLTAFFTYAMFFQHYPLKN